MINHEYHEKNKDRDNAKKREIAKLKKDFMDILIKNNINNPTQLKKLMIEARQKGMIN